MSFGIIGVRTHETLLHLRTIRGLAHEFLSSVHEDGKGKKGGADDDDDDGACCPPSRRNLGVKSISLRCKWGPLTTHHESEMMCRAFTALIVSTCKRKKCRTKDLRTGEPGATKPKRTERT